MVRPDWIAVDWGTSRLRAWAMAGERVLEARASDKGMGALTPDGFEPALLELAGDWLGRATPVIACGMVGARTGWAEAEYRAVPCTPLDPLRATRPPVRDARLVVPRRRFVPLDAAQHLRRRRDSHRRRVRPRRNRRHRRRCPLRRVCR